MASLHHVEARYPHLSISIRSTNPHAVVAGVREELRREGVERGEIDNFTAEALASPCCLERVLEVARQWIGSAEAACG